MDNNSYIVLVRLTLPAQTQPLQACARQGRGSSYCSELPGLSAHGVCVARGTDCWRQLYDAPLGTAGG